ncbi:MAG: hypothetical protein GY822_16875 [Deltaproteobacteria bacterium]|nr:hypothetical protein [Deltaproteobacteria bacterium]
MSPLLSLVRPLFFLDGFAARPRVLFVVACGLSALFCVPQIAFAQNLDPAGHEAPVEKEHGDDVKSKDKPKATYSKDALSVEDALNVLRAIEAQRSVGLELNDDERRALLHLLRRHPDERVRAHAVSILPWLSSRAVGKATLKALTDESALVRLRAMTALLVLIRSSDEELLRAAESASAELLRDDDDQVACAAGRVYHRLAPSNARDAMLRLSDKISDARFACFAAQTRLPERDFDVEAPVRRQRPNPKKEKDKDAEEENVDDKTPNTAKNWLEGGDAVFLASFAAAGLVTGALVPATLFPAQDVLTYSRTRSQWSHEELSIGVGITGAVVGGLTLGAVAYGLKEGVGGLSSLEASAIPLAAGAGGLAGFGLARMFNQSGASLAIAVVAFETAGLTLGTSYAYLFDVTGNDLALSAASGTAGLALGGLVALALTPETASLFEDVEFLPKVHRFDFAMGSGLFVGGSLSMLTLLASPVLELPTGRVVSALAASSSLAGVGLGLTYILLPVSFEGRGQIAAGVGLLGQVIGVGLGYFLLPDSWVDDLAATQSQGLVSFSEGQFRPGMPRVIPLAPASGSSAPAVALSFVEGRF